MKVASRFLLPLEMFLGLKLIVLAITGGFGGGTLFTVLKADGENISWLIAVLTVGIPVVVLAVHEWFFLRDADETMIWRSTGARAGFAALGVGTWVSTLGYIIAHGAAQQTMYYALLSPIAAAFHAWCFVENLKVRYALDPKYPTSQLRFHR